ncbi:MAG TPA: MaoC family dehydratase N-terminal domain-containing protein [Actinomycetota bacterium]|jgi:acyl dehydratase
MALNRSFIGREYPPSIPYEVGREKIKEFANAIGDMNPVYHDEDAAKAAGYADVIAPPTFLTVTNFRYSPQIIGDPELGLNYAMVVHGEQEYELHRPVVPGMRLVGKPRIADITARGRNEFMVIEASIETEAGEPVATARSTVVSRGTAEGA